jgi:hypothetical protein
MDHPADCRSDLPPPSAVQIILFQPYIIYVKRQASCFRPPSETLVWRTLPLGLISGPA